MTFDPNTFPLEADLSRADVRVLHRLCAGKRVVEFGCGGSTVLLGMLAGHVTSYDTDPSWVKRTQRRLARERATTCDAVVLCGPEPPAVLPVADVYFIDGHPPHRAAWIKAVIAHDAAPVIIVHDSRSEVMTEVSAAIVHPFTLSLRTIVFHPDESNMMVITIGKPVVRRNWNEEEPANRLPFLGDD